MSKEKHQEVKKELISWERFGELCNALALKIQGEFNPDIIVGIVKAGVLPGAVIASLFRRDFYTIKLSRRKNDRVVHARPILFVPITDSVYGKQVLVVDWITRTGETLELAKKEIEAKQAKTVKTCSLFGQPAGYKPDWHIYESENQIVCPWNQFVIEDGTLVHHPEYW